MAIAAIGQLRKYLALRKSLAGVLSRPLRLEDCAAIVGQQRARRGETFLARMQRDVYENSRMPVRVLRDYERSELPG